MYGDAVLIYMGRLENTDVVKVVKDPDGRVWTVFFEHYGTEEYCFLIRRAREYRIPPSILELLELLESGTIRKLHANTIFIKLDAYIPDWDDTMRISSFCGIPWTGNPCSKCDSKNIFCGKWIDHNRTTLCMSCYNGEKGFQYINMTDFNVADWVIFSNDLVDSGYYCLLINCNPDSTYYGQVMLIDNNDRAVIIGNVDTLHTYILKWFDVHSEHTQMRDVLDMECGSTYHLGVVERYNIFPPDTRITFRMLLENAHVQKGTYVTIDELIGKTYEGQFMSADHVNRIRTMLQKRIHEPIFDRIQIGSIYDEMEDRCMYTDTCAAYFHVWLRDQFT